MPGRPLRTNVVLVPPGRREEQSSTHYPNPALDAELAYRRELVARPSPAGSRRGAWTATAAGRAALTAVPVLSAARATIDDVPRWDDAPMVGRADELARLLAHVERAGRGPASAVLLAGDAGVGKTRLLDELAAGAPPSAASACSPGTASTSATSGCPTCPFVDLLRPVAGRPDAGARRSADTRCSPGCWPAGPGVAARRPGRRGPDLGRAAAAPGGAPARRRRPAAAVRVGGRR